MAIVVKKEISTNALTSEQIKMVNLIYPVGTCYVTTNSSFNPNTAWVGTWTSSTSGGKVTWTRTA